ncbi:MAG TPA: hypothetical protein ENK67_08530 [Flavobacteriia bacterium]|nr:hypothetical protein [Flavobacteriia bacterium]
MIKKTLTLFLIVFTITVFSQRRKTLQTLESNGLVSNRLNDNDSTFLKGETKIDLSGTTKFTDYKIFNQDRDTTYVDTTMTIEKYYKFNFLRKDDFTLMPFHNQGQTANKLAYNFDDLSLYPKFGARAKHFNYYQVQDVFYYQVPTPTTELAWRTGLEQGQFLDALITLNLTKRHNIALAYKGLRSLGKYRYSLASHGNFRMSYSYLSKDEKYQLRSHVTAQDLYNEENGGLTPEALILFEADNINFRDRGQLTTNFTDASNVLRGNRYYIEHDYTIYRKKDTLNKVKNSLKIGHIFNYNTKHYEFDQGTPNIAVFGDTIATSIHDKAFLETVYNEVSVGFESPIILGRLKVMAGNYNYNYGFKDKKIIGSLEIPKDLKGNTTSLKAKWDTYYKNIKLSAQAGINVIGNLNGNYFKAEGIYHKDSLFSLKASISNSNKSPNFNFILYQSAYKNYNWYHDNLKNQISRNLNFSFLSEKFLDATATITQLDNYTFFKDTNADNQLEPAQFNGTINYLKLKVKKKIRYKKFTLDNTILYQKVTNGEAVLRIPQLVTRNSLYYSNYLFKGKPLYLQTGVSVKYFTKYKIDAYNPLLAEFYVQDNMQIGDFPIVDLFVNAKVRQTRLYFKFDNFGTVFLKKKNYFSAPNYPYRDFVIRFGLVWNFFI